MSSGRKRILLIEDEPLLLEITSFRLELLGYDVVHQTAGDSSLAWLGENVPDLILLGYIGDMNPVELLNRVSDDPRTSDVPLLYLSANSDLDEVQRAYNAGADEYLLTPYDPLVLEHKVHGLLAAAELQRVE